MKASKWALIAWVGIAAGVVSGCSSEVPNTERPEPTSASSSGGRLQADVWQVRMKAACASGEAADCRLAYGLTLSSDGTYGVGPGPQEQSLSGPLDAGDQAELKSIVESHLSDQPEAEVCIAVPQAMRNFVVREQVTLIRNGREKIVYQLEGEELCYQGLGGARGNVAVGSGPEVALKYFANFRRFADRYYPLPFPNENCEDSIASLGALYSDVRRCAADTDCAYFDTDFVPVDRGAFKFLLTGSCSGVAPLVVANRSLGAQMQGALIQGHERAVTACRSRVSARGCAGFPAFLPTQPQPVCRDGVCRINPDVGFRFF